MRVYFDESGAILYTMNGNPNTMPEGDYIEVADDDIEPLAAFRVIDGKLIHQPPDRTPENIINAPRQGFGGPSMKDTFNGNL